MAVTVFIWNNNVGAEYSYLGHASLHIGYAPVARYMDDRLTTFVSWIPVKPGGGRSHSGKVLADPNLNILQDLTFEGYAPDHVIQIPTTLNQETKMMEEWRAIRHKRKFPGQVDPAPSYDLKRKNCATVVQRVLKSAELGWASNPLKWNIDRRHRNWTPLDVRDLALGYSGARKIAWFDWVNMQQLDDLQKTVLYFLQRRHARHGSSGAPARNSAPINVRLLHAFGSTVSSLYKNTHLLMAIEQFGKAGATFTVCETHWNGRLGPDLIWDLKQLVDALKNNEFKYFQKLSLSMIEYFRCHD